MSQLKKNLHFLRALVEALFYDMRQGDITLRATGLVYTTLLSLAPLLALSFSVLKGFGVHNQLEPMLLQVLTPLGEKAEELTKQILGFVDNVQVGVLGILGLGLLLYTVVSLMQKIEEAFNYVWEVPKARNLIEQVRDYLTVVLVGPIIIFSGLGVWSYVIGLDWVQAAAAIEPFGDLLADVVAYVPIFIIIITFTFLYMYMPNTKVKFKPALMGAIVAGIVWQIAGWIFASFVVNSGQQTAIYSIFASLFLFMLWLYVAWIIVLGGARLAFYLQYPDAVYRPRQPKEPSLQTRELLAAAVLKVITHRFERGEPPVNLEDLRKEIPVSRFLLMDTLDELRIYGVLSQDNNTPPHYLLQISPNLVTVEHIRRYLWQGDAAQQQQALQVKQQAGLTDSWLNDLVTKPRQTLQEALPLPSTLKPQP
jgi:membrane protein